MIGFFQQERCKTPSVTGMKMESVNCPDSMGMGNPSKVKFNLSAPTQRKIMTGTKKQLLSSPESYSF